MLIVSQDRTSTINFDNVEKIEVIYKEIIIFYKGTEHAGMNGTESIGLYKTEERAKEVFEEIQIAYTNNEMLKLYKVNIEGIIQEKELFRNLVYRMPKE